MVRDTRANSRPSNNLNNMNMINNFFPQQHSTPSSPSPSTKNSTRSTLLEEFRNNKVKKYELQDIVGHIVEFSGDQVKYSLFAFFLLIDLSTVLDLSSKD